MRNLRSGSIIDYRFPRGRRYRSAPSSTRSNTNICMRQRRLPLHEHRVIRAVSIECRHTGRKRVYYLVPNTTVEFGILRRQSHWRGAARYDGPQRSSTPRPTVQKATASAVMKAAKLETGLTFRCRRSSTRATSESGHIGSALCPACYD